METVRVNVQGFTSTAHLLVVNYRLIPVSRICTSFNAKLDPDSAFLVNGPGCRSGSRILLIKKWKKLHKIVIYIFDPKLQFTCPNASIKEAQVTWKAFSPPKRTSSTSKLKISSHLWVISALLNPDRMRRYSVM
jgi:hypothetical protein